MEITFYCEKVIMLVLLLHHQHQTVQIVLCKKWSRTPQIMVNCLPPNTKSVVEGVELLLKKSDAPDYWGHFLQKRKQSNENMVTKHAKIQLIKEFQD